MKEGVGAHKLLHSKELNQDLKTSKPDLRAERVDEMRRKVAGLGTLKISMPYEGEKSNAPSFDEDEINLSPALLSPRQESRSVKYWVIYVGAALITLTWLAFCATYAFIHPETFVLAPAELGAFLAGVFAPPALLWLIAGSINRRADVEHYSFALRSELHKLLFPNDASESIINQDVQRLVQQAAEISAASRAVMKSLQRARQGLRMEVRDFSGVSKKTEFHIDRLAQGLSERSAKLASLTAEIEQRTSQIDARAQSGADAWDTATLKILERASTIEAAMGRGADKVLEAADRADSKVKSVEGHMARSYQTLNSAVDEVATRLSGLTVRFDDQIDGLGRIETALSKKTDNLGDVIQLKIGELRAITDDALSAMGKSGEMIKEQKEGFDRSARIFADQAKEIGSIVSESVGGLNEAVDHVMSRGVELEEKLSTRTQELRELSGALHKEAEAVDRAGSNAAAKLDETLALVTAGSETIHASARRAADLIGETLKDSRRNITQLGDMGEASARKLAASLSEVEEKLRKAETYSTQNDIRLKDIGTSLEIQISKLEGANDLLKNASQAAEQLDTRFTKVQGQMQDINALSVRLSDKSDSVQKSLGKSKETLDDIAETTMTKLENFDSSLRARTEELDNVTRRAEGKLKDIDTLLGENATNLRKHADDTSHALREANLELNISSEKMESIKNIVLDAKDALQAAGDSALSKMHQVGSKFNDCLALLETDTQNLLDILNTAQESLNATNDNVGSVSAIAYEKIHSIGEILQERQDDLQRITDQLEIKVKGLQGSLQDQFQDLTASVELAMTMITETGAQITSQANKIEETSERAASSFERVGFVAREEGERLNKSAELAIQRTARQADTLREAVKALLDNSTALNDLKTASDTLAQRSSEVKARMQEALHAAQTFNKDLKLQALQTTETSRETVETLGRAMSTLVEKTDDMTQASEAALEAARMAATGFGKQAESLFKASEDAAQRMSDMQSLDTRTQREGFMESAKFMLEKLHSLTVDISRMVEGEVSEKSWKAYQNGDIAAFTRRLANTKDAVPMDRARAKYIKDAEFRAYVQRYTRQFEEAYSQAREIDHKDILCATLATSEVADVYIFLCAVAGSRPCFDTGALKAA